MKKSKRMLRKLLLLTSSALLLVSLTVGVTLAYLTDTASVTNTFTVGNVDITMDEALVGDDGDAIMGESAKRVTQNKYHLLPGQKYHKDPTVHVDAKSEDGWLFVKVENGIKSIEAQSDSIAVQMAAQGFEPVEGYDSIYAYKEIVSAGDDIVVFSSFVIDGNVDNTTLAQYANAEIVVSAYMVQAAGFNTAEEALTTVGIPKEWENNVAVVPGGSTEGSEDSDSPIR